MAKEIRPMKRVNQDTGQEEIFYPATTSGAVVDANKRKSQEAINKEVEEKVSELEEKIENPENVPICGDTDSADFAISDENGNELARFAAGHFRTKHFNSEELQGVPEKMASVMELMSSVQKSQSIAQTTEDGFFIIDEELNIGASYTENGLNFVSISESAKREITYDKKWYERKNATITTELAGTIQSANGTKQGGINVDNLYFQFYDGNGVIRVFNLDDFSLVASIKTEISGGNHCNNVSLGNKYHSDDRFPLFYVGAATTPSIQVIRIDNDFNCSLVQTINCAGADIGTVCTVDTNKQWIYSAKEGGSFYRFKIPSLDSENVTIENFEAVGSISTSVVTYGIQDTIVNNGFLLTVFGLTSSAATLVLLDMFNKIEVWKHHITVDAEPEAVSYYKDCIYVVCSSNSVYKIKER